MDSDNEKLIDYCLKEAKDQYKIYLEGFNDIKLKSNILLVVCSIFISLSLSNSEILCIIIKYKLVIPYIISTGLFTASIILIIIGLKAAPIEIPYLKDIISTIGNFESIKVKEAVAKEYNKNLNSVIKKLEEKRKLIDLAEKFIIVGVIIVFVLIIIITF